jgi:carbon storage regulator
MLILSRRRNEAIVIQGNIVVKVLEVDDNRVKIGVEAPKSVRVDRQELHERKRLEGEGNVQPAFSKARG